MHAGIARLAASGATAQVKGDADELTVSVEIAFSFIPTFFVGMFKSPIGLTVNATAQATGAANVCVIALEEEDASTIEISSDSSLTAENCAVYANSRDQKAIVVNSGAVLTSALICSSGGYDGATQSFNPEPLTDCPVREDPLASRDAPVPPPGCDHVAKILEKGASTLTPGVYCKGLKLDNNSDVTFAPGIYFIKDGMLEIKSKSRATGKDVGFFFYGDNAEVSIIDEADVALSAPLNGAMAGILFWRDANSKEKGDFLVKSPNVSTLVGTVYLPTGEFIGDIDAGGEIAEASAFTAIIAEKISLKNKSTLVLNTDYGATSVPVPEGVTSAGGSVFLRQ